MPFTNNPVDGTKIHYEVEGSGPPLLLIHGFSGSVHGWADNGYRDALKGKYRLVMYDLRAHGDSGHPHGPASYTPEMHVKDALAVLHDLGVEKTHVFGYSMGAWIGFAVLKHASHRMLSFIAGGSDPYPKRDSPFLNRIIEWRQAGLEASLVKNEEMRGERLSEPARSRYLAQDNEAQIAAVTQSRDSAGLDGDLGSTTIPVMGYAGSEDPFHDGVAKAISEIPNARFVSLEGLDHGQGFMRSDLVLPHVTKFLAGVESARSLA